MSTSTKIKAEVAAPEAESKPLDLPSPPAPRSRATRPEDVPAYEALVGKKFVRKDHSSHDVFIPKNIFPEFLMNADEMGECSAFAARFYVETCKNGNGEPEEPKPTIIFGREVRARPQVKAFMTDCATFVELHEEKHD